MKPHQVTQRFVELIDGVMEIEGLEQQQVAERIGILSTHISRMRRGEFVVKIEKMLWFKKAFPYVILSYCFGESKQKFDQELLPKQNKNRHNLKIPSKVRRG